MIRWTDYLDESAGIIAKGHVAVSPIDRMIALRKLGDGGYSHDELMDLWANGGRVEHIYRGTDPTGEYAWLTCDAAGVSGLTHYCDAPCRVHDHWLGDCPTEPCSAGHCDDSEDCRCEDAWCEGDDSEVIALDPEPITLLSVDWDRWGEVEARRHLDATRRKLGLVA